MICILLVKCFSADPKQLLPLFLHNNPLIINKYQAINPINTKINNSVRSLLPFFLYPSKNRKP